MYKSDQTSSSFKKIYRYDFKNGIFEGNVVQYKRQGFGVAILDDGYVYIGFWHNDKVHGKALIFMPNIGVMLANFQKGMQVGIQIVKLYKFKNEYFCVNIKDHLKFPKEAVIFSNSRNKSVQAVIKSDNQIEFKEFIIVKEYEELIQQLDSFSMQFSNDFKIMKTVSLDGDQQIKLGFIGESQNKLNGLGLIIDQGSFKIVKQGLFTEDKLEGIGKIVMPNEDAYEGLFKNNQIDGKGFYFTAKTNSYISGIFKKDVCIEFIQDGLEYPLNQIRKFKQTMHECSIHFYSSSFSARDFITIDWNYLQDFMDRSKFAPVQFDGNSSPCFSSLLDKNQNTINNFYRNDEFQQIIQTNRQQQNTLQATNSSFNKYQPKLTQRRSSSINDQRDTLPSYHLTKLNSLNVSQNFGKNGLLNNSNRASSLQTNYKYSTKYTVSNREHQVENPEQQISNSKIDFGKLNWGQKPEASDLSFSHTNFNVNKQGQDLCDLLKNDEAYQKESKINYFKDSGKIPSYQETIKEGELIKKRLVEITDVENDKLTNNNIEKQILEQSLKSKRSTPSQQGTNTSINITIMPQQLRLGDNQINSIDSYNKSRRLSNQNFGQNVDGYFQMKEDQQDQVKIQSISDYLKNVSDNNQESYLNQKIDSCDFRHNKGRNLVPYNPYQYGKDFSRYQGCESSQSDYSPQEYQDKKRSSSVSSPNTIVSVSKSTVNCFDKKVDISPERVSLSIEKGLNQNIQSALNNQIHKNNENIIRLQNIYEDKFKSDMENNDQKQIQAQENQAKTDLSNQKKQTQEMKKQDISNQKQQGLPDQSQQSFTQNNNSNQPMKFIKVLGVPHSNKSDQTGIYLKMKEEAIKQKELQTNSILDSQSSIQKGQEIIPSNCSSPFKIKNQDSPQKSILEQYMNPETCFIKKNDNSNSKQSQTDQLQANQINNFHHLPFDKNNRLPSGIQNQSNTLSNNSRHSQISNEFQHLIQAIPNSQLDMLKEQRMKLNNILYQRKYYNNSNLSSARPSGYSVSTKISQENDNSFKKINNLNTLQIQLRTQSTDNSPYNISKKNSTDLEEMEFKTKSMVRFNLSSDTPERHSPFNYRRQQTPEKSSLKASNKSHQSSNLSYTSNESDLKITKRLSTSIDLSNCKYHYSENPVNLFYTNTLQKTQNQWLDLYSVNPQILANTSPLKYHKSRQIQNHQQTKQEQQQQQCLPQIA